MKITKDFFDVKILNNSMYFKFTFIIFALVHMLRGGQFITGYFSNIFVIWGVLLGVNKIFVKKISFKKEYLYIIMMFMVAYFITIIMNREMNLFSNLKTLIWTFIIFTCFFVNDVELSKEIIIKEFYLLSKIITNGVFITSLVSLLMFCFNVSYWAPSASGATIPQGYFAARLWGIYFDPNIACNLALVTIILCIVLIFKGGSIVTYNIINIIVQFIYIILSASRSGVIGLIVVIIGLVFLYFEIKMDKKIKKNIVRYLISIACALIISILIVGIFPQTRKVLVNIPQFFVIENQNNESNSDSQISTERGDVVGEDKTNSRLDLWISGIKIGLENPIFGVGDRNISERAKISMPDSILASKTVHNGFIHLFAGGGITATILMICLLGAIAKTAFRNIINITNRNKIYIIYVLINIMIASLLATTLFLTEIFYKNSFTAVIFWIYTGYIVYFNEMVIKSDKEII